MCRICASDATGKRYFGPSEQSTNRLSDCNLKAGLVKVSVTLLFVFGHEAFERAGDGSRQP
jgi:hypothetical protein